MPAVLFFESRQVVDAVDCASVSVGPGSHNLHTAELVATIQDTRFKGAPDHSL